MHHVFCGLHVIHNLGKYAEKAIYEWEKIIEEQGKMHDGFKLTQKSRTYNLLFEISKLLSKSHGDQKNGKADEWQAYLKNNKSQNFILSFLHHRFNVVFLIGGVYYYHKDSMVDFLLSQDRENFLLQSIREDIDYVVFLDSSRALGTIEKLISGPLFRRVVQAEHIFDLNNMWESLLNFLELNSHDASNLFNGNIIFDDSLLTKDAMFEKLFQETENPIYDSLTEECLEIICCTCFFMIKSQLRDQLPGGKYFAPNNETR